MREIVFDTETTGLDPENGHRIIQIGALELENTIPTGRTYMALIHPERDIEPGAAEIHGITLEMLEGKPTFTEIVEDFFAFIGDAPLVAHNAEFDMRFLNAELKWCRREPLPRARFVDTLDLARRKFPGQRLSLDALCNRFGIDNSVRERHDALIDCRLLAEVYLELCGGRQQGLSLASDRPVAQARDLGGDRNETRRAPRPHAPTPEELAAHEAFVAGLKGAIWLKAD